MQAVGSIGAIVGAVWLGNLQHAREIARRDFEAWQAARAPALDDRGLLRAAQFDVQQAASAATGAGGIEWYLDRGLARRALKSRRRVIEAFDWSTLKPSGLAVDFLEGRDAIVGADDLIDTCATSGRTESGLASSGTMGAALLTFAEALERSADSLTRDLEYPEGVLSDKVFVEDS